MQVHAGGSGEDEGDAGGRAEADALSASSQHDGAEGAGRMAEGLNAEMFAAPRDGPQCPYCFYLHYRADLVRLDAEHWRCSERGQAFTPGKRADSQAIGFRD